MNYTFDFRKHFSPLFLMVLAIEVGCFIVDLNFQRDYPKGLLYFFPLLLIWNTTPMQIFTAISFVTVLEVIGYFYSPQGLVPYHLSVLNRFSSLLVFWIVNVVFIARIRAHKAQLKSEKQYRQLIGTANSIVLRWDPTGTILFINRYGVLFFGYTEEEMLGRNVLMLVPGMESTGRDLTTLSLKFAKYPGRYVTFVTENVCKDGTKVWVSWTNTAICDECGRLVEQLAIGNDITYQKQVENELRQSRSKLEAVLENINDGLTIRQPDGEFLLINRSCMDMFGCTTEDEAKRELSHLQENWELFDDQGNLLSFGKWPFTRGFREPYHNVIVRMKRKDNSVDRYNSHSGTPVYDSNGTLIAVVATFQDITERIQMERTLRENEQKFINIFKKAPIPISMIRERDFTLIDVNHVWEDTFGITYCQAIGKTLEELGIRDSLKIHTKMCELFQRQGFISDIEISGFRTKKYSDATVNVNVVRMYIGGERYLLASTQDVTDRKLTEANLKKLTTILSEGQKIAHLGSFEYFPDTCVTAWSEEEYRIYGIDPSGPSPSYNDLLVKNFHPEDSRLIDNTLVDAVNKQSVYDLEHRIVLPGGGVRWVHERAHPYFDEHGHMSRYIGVTLDITERKNTEEELRQRALEAEEGKRMLDAIMEYAPEGITISDARESKILLLSRHGQDLLGISYDGKTAFDLALERKVFYPDATTPIPDEELPLIKAMREEKTILNYEVVQPDGKGEKLHLLCNAAPIRNAKGETYAGIITWRDITRQKKTEQALKESEEKASTVLKSLTEGVLLLDTNGNIVQANPAMMRLFDRAFEELAHPENYLTQQIIRPDGTPKPGDEQPANIALRTGKPVFDVEEGVRCKDGSILWVSINVQPLRNEQGVIVGTVASYFDITRRKNAEEAQKKSEEWLKILNEDLENMVIQRTGQVRSLATALTLAEQRERKRISYILHEELQQLLFGIRMLIGQYLREHSAESTYAGELDDIVELQVILDKALETTRILSIELNPPVLRSQGLDAALDWLVHHMEKNYNLTIDLHMRGALSSIRNETQLMLIQMVRELLVNVLQHAETRTARVDILHKNRKIRISVNDEGKGFDTATVFEKRNDESRLSLMSIRERLSLFNGKLSVVSTPGEGTTCVITMPVDIC